MTKPATDTDRRIDLFHERDSDVRGIRFHAWVYRDEPDPGNEAFPPKCQLGIGTYQVGLDGLTAASADLVIYPSADILRRWSLILSRAADAMDSRSRFDVADGEDRPPCMHCDGDTNTEADPLWGVQGGRIHLNCVDAYGKGGS